MSEKNSKLDSVFKEKDIGEHKMGCQETYIIVTHLLCRNVAENFNEAKLIGFSCSKIVKYLAGPGKGVA